MARSKFPQPSPLSPFKQAAFVCGKYDTFSSKVTGRDKVKLKGTLRPSLLHKPYQVEIEYQLGKFPSVRIVSPEIDPDAPHTFADNSICTFYPAYEIWNRRMKLSETLIPWISDWIFHYEIWLVTKKWNGDADPRHPRRGQNAG